MNSPNGISPYDDYLSPDDFDRFHVYNSTVYGITYRIEETLLERVRNFFSYQKLNLLELASARANNAHSVNISRELVEGAQKLRIPQTENRIFRTLRELQLINPMIGASTSLDAADKVSADFPAARLLRASYCYDLNELIVFVRLLEARRYISMVNSSTQRTKFQLSLDGLEYIELHQVQNLESSMAFVAMWFDSGMDEAWDSGFEPALIDAGYQPLRIDKKEHINMIDDEIISDIRRSRFIVADFTSLKDSPRGGVYFEAGYALGFGIPVVWTCRKDAIDFVHFDTRQFAHILWETPEDLRKQLTRRIQAAIGQGPLSTNGNQHS